MAEITAQAVNEFRKRTGLGLMECKALLKEADGDPKKAETLAKERGIVKGAGRAGRATSAGRVEAAIAPDGHSGALVELNCETDFVARNDEFRQAARDLAEHVLHSSAGGDVLDQNSLKDPSRTIRDVLMDLNVRTGENVNLSRTARFAGTGRVDAYIHHDGKSGALVEVEGPADAALVKDLALQVVAAKPLCVRREDMPADAVAEQKRIFVTQVADKPENIREKIAEGKLNAWFGESTLLEQEFVKDSSKKVRDVVKAVGPDLKVARFARFVVGEAP
jgi:elongation factor Ts